MDASFVLFSEKLSGGHCEYTGLISSKADMEEYFKSSAVYEDMAKKRTMRWMTSKHVLGRRRDDDPNKRLKEVSQRFATHNKFLLDTNFDAGEQVFMYQFTHSGSGQDRPEYRVSYDETGKVLTCDIYDANQSGFRTMDLRTGSDYFMIRIASSVQKIQVNDKQGYTKGRSFYTTLTRNDDISLDEAVKVVKGFPKYEPMTDEEIKTITCLDFREYYLTTYDFNALSQLQHLQSIQIKGGHDWNNTCSIGCSAQNLNKLVHLKHLSVGSQGHQDHHLGFGGFGDDKEEYQSCGFTDSQLSSLTALEKLESIDIGMTKVSNEGLLNLNYLFPQLKSIAFDDYFEMTHERARILSTLPNLESIQHFSCSSASAFQELASGGLCLQMRRLKFSFGHKAPDVPQIMTYLCQMSELTHIAINTFNAQKFGDPDFEKLKSLCKLESLAVVGYNQITNDSLYYLRNMSNLEELALGRCCNIGDEGLEHLLHLKKLKKLDLRQTAITNLGLEWIAMYLPEMADLNLYHVERLTKQETLQSFRKMKKLKYCTANALSDQRFFHRRQHNIPTLAGPVLVYRECKDVIFP